MAKVLPQQAIDTRSAAELYAARPRAAAREVAGDPLVSWKSPAGKRQADGEADFVMIHPDLGVLVVEVKGGGVRTSEGEWFSVDRHGTEHGIKNPFEQAKSSKYALLRFLNERMGKVTFPIEHAVALPDVHGAPLGLAAPREITWDRAIDTDPDSAIAATLNHYGMTATLSPRQVEDIVSLLLPSVDLKQLRVEDGRRGSASSTATVSNCEPCLVFVDATSFANVRRLRFRHASPSTATSPPPGSSRSGPDLTGGDGWEPATLVQEPRGDLIPGSTPPSRRSPVTPVE